MPVRVLIAEDDAQLRNLLALVVGRIGLEAETAADGVEALAKLRQNDYSLLLLDLMMPRLSGYELIAAMKEFPKRPAVVVLTAMTTERFLDLDPDVVTAVIKKPFDIDVIAAVIGETARQLGSTKAVDAALPLEVPPPPMRPAC